MIIDAISTGKTIEEAKKNALNQLGMDEQDVSIEIIEMSSKKILGLFGGKLAKVRAYYDDGKPDVAQIKAIRPQNNPPKTINKSVEKAKPKQAAKPVTQKNTTAKPVKNDLKTERARPPKTPYVDEPGVDKSVSDADFAITYAFLTNILDSMKISDYKITLKETTSTIKVQIDGEDTSCVIGHRGDVLDNLQYLCNLISNKTPELDKRILLNVNDYRLRREETLKSLATKMAGQVLKSGRNQSLEPMSSHERRVVHSLIQEIDGLNSWSVGEGNTRRVIIGIDKATSGNNQVNNKPDNKPAQPKKPIETSAVEPKARPMIDRWANDESPCSIVEPETVVKPETIIDPKDNIKPTSTSSVKHVAHDSDAKTIKGNLVKHADGYDENKPKVTEKAPIEPPKTVHPEATLYGKVK